MIQQATVDEIAWQWAYLDERHVEFKRRLRPILRALTFEAMSADMPLLDAIRFIQEALRDKRNLRHLAKADFPLARAILKDAPVLVLDEATAHLDPLTEQELLRALDTFMAGRTALIIAHRQPQLAHCDRVLALEDGKL